VAVGISHPIEAGGYSQGSAVPRSAWVGRAASRRAPADERNRVHCWRALRCDAIEWPRVRRRTPPAAQLHKYDVALVTAGIARKRPSKEKTLSSPRRRPHYLLHRHRKVCCLDWRRANYRGGEKELALRQREMRQTAGSLPTAACTVMPFTSAGQVRAMQLRKLIQYWRKTGARRNPSR